MATWVLAVAVVVCGARGDLAERLERLRASEAGAQSLVELYSLYADALRSGRRGSQMLGEILIELDRFGESAHELVRSPDKRLRKAAAWALGVTAARGAGGALKELLDDGDEGVRLAAVDALAQLATAEAIEALRLATSDGSEKARLSALKVLKTHDPEWVAQQVVAFLSDPSDEVAREAASFAAGNWPECARMPGIVEAASCGLGRFDEAEELLVLAGEDAVEAAVRALGSESVEAAEAATRVLAKIGAGGATEQLLKAVREGDEQLARTAAEALGKLGNHSALMELAREGGDRARTAILGLARAKRSGDLVDFLRSYLERGGELAREAARSLAGLDAREALPDLARMAESADPADAIEAVKAMVAMGDRSKVGVLLSRLSSEDRWAALRSAAALAKLGNVCGFPTLIQALGSDDRMTRAYASAALAGAVDSGVEFPIDGPPERRKKLAKMWRIWWETHKRALELAAEE